MVAEPARSVQELLGVDECSWLEFKVDNQEPREIGEYVSALANGATRDEILEATGGFNNGAHPCYVLAIYLPSERDVGAAATFRRDAIAADVTKYVQRYEPRADAIARIIRDNPEQQYTTNTAQVWYNAFEPCASGVPGDGLSCDEFPNLSMVGSGPPAQLDEEGNLVSNFNTALDLIDGADNAREGSRYGRQFIVQCAAQVQINREPFVVLPLTGVFAPPETLAVC